MNNDVDTSTRLLATEIGLLVMDMFELGKRDPKPLLAAALKLSEEVGELSEAVLHHEGHLPHKTMKEPLAGEVVDVIHNAIAPFVKAYSGTTEDLARLLIAQMHRKNAKWDAVLLARDA